MKRGGLGVPPVRKYSTRTNLAIDDKGRHLYILNNKCTSCGDCVAVCKVGAIDFNREPQALTEAFDLVLDLGARPLIALHAPPQGYFALNTNAQAVKQIASAAERDALPKGAQYSAPNGRIYEKQ